MNIGIVGFGNMGKTHAFCIENIKYFYRDEGIDPVLYGICTSTKESAEGFAVRYGIKKAFGSFEELISCPEIDIVDICTPNVFHYEQLIAAIKAGKHIYCEKPLCVSSEQANKVAAAARESGLICAVVFNTRFHLPVLKTKELIEDGRIGDVLSFSTSFLHSSALDVNKTGWKQDSDICGGGVLFDLGSHALDMMYYLLGGFESLSAKSQIAFPKRTSISGEENWQTNADEAFYMLCKTKRGALGTITVSKIHHGTNDDFSFDIYGTRGSLRFSLMEPNWLYFYDANTPLNTRGFTRIECVGRFPEPASGFPGQKAPVGWIRSHVGSMYNYLSFVQKGENPSPSFEDAAYIQAVMEAAYDADLKKAWVSVDAYL